jgi:hypothetical protein
MKNVKLKLAALTIAAATFFAFTEFRAGTIKGLVNPADGATNAWAVSATDTLKATIDKGTFSIADAPPGTYRVIIEAKPPYKNAAKDGVTVTEGQTTDVGEIKLEQ